MAHPPARLRAALGANVPARPAARAPVRVVAGLPDEPGMSPWYDVIAFFGQRCFALRNQILCGVGSGNNEFVFVKMADAQP